MSISTLRTVGMLGEGEQDAFLCPLFFMTKLAGALIARSSADGAKDRRARGLLHLSDRINEARFTLRFFVGVNAAHALLSGNYKSVPELYSSDKQIAQIRFAQYVLDIAYNLVELPAYLRTIGAPQLHDYNGEALGRLSCWIWLARTLLEIYAQTRQIQTIDDRRLGSLAEKQNELERERFQQVILLAANLTDVPLAYNWGEGAGRLGDLQIGAIGTVGSLLRLYIWWRAHARKAKRA
jgi:hypothetical protein